MNISPQKEMLTMREVPKAELPDEAFDLDQCRQAVEEAFKHPEPRQAFDSDVWLEKAKARLRRQGASQ